LIANLKDTQIAFATDTNRIIWREGSSFWTFDAGLKWNGTNFEGNEVSTGVIKVYQFNGTEALQIGDGGGNPNLLTTGILTLNADQLKLTLANTTGAVSKFLAVTSAGKVIETDAPATNLQDAYDNSTDPEIVTDATRGALTLKRGSTLDSDSVLEIQNGAGSNTTILTGNGQLQLDSATVQPQIVFDSNGGVDLDHYIQYNPGGVGGITINSQQAASEVTTLELNRSSSGEFKLSGNSSDTTKSAQLINTYSVPSDEAYLQLISRNDKTATKTATITVASGSTDLATDSEIELSAEKINTFTASVIGRDPVASNEFATKNYTDSAIGSAIIGTAVYKGAWNASTNSPTITSGAGTQGDFYIVSVAGTTSIDGVNEWSPGDWILFNGTTWEKVDNSQTIPVNVGTGVEVFKSLNGVTNVADFRTLIGGTKVGLTQNANDITIDDSNVAGLNTANTFSADQTFGDNITLSRTSSTTISRSESSGYVGLNGGTSTTDGAGVLLYGSTNANASEGRLRSDGLTKLLWDDQKIQLFEKLNLASTTNASPSTGDIWRDSTSGKVEIQGTTEINGGDLSLENARVVKGPATASSYIGMTWNSSSLGSMVLCRDGFGQLRINTNQILGWFSNQVVINQKINLSSTTNASPATGDIWRDTTSGAVEIASPISASGTSSTINSKHIVNRLSKTITLENPTAADTIPIFRTDKAITIDKISYEIIGSTNCVFDIEWGNNAGGAGTVVTSSPMTANATQAETTTFSDATISANNYLQLDVNSISGTPDYITVTIHYTMDAND
jgi:hypothetical protein